MNDLPRIAILEGYDPTSLGEPSLDHKLGLDGAGDRRAFEWHACKIGRKIVVERYPPLYAGEGGQCGGSAKFHVAATSKKIAHHKAVAMFRQERQEKKAARRASLSGLQTQAQVRFTRAAKACKLEARGGGRKAAYLKCMKVKLSK